MKYYGKRSRDTGREGEKIEICREREREAERERDRHRERGIERKRQAQRERDRHREREAQRERHREREAQRERDRQREICIYIILKKEKQRYGKEGENKEIEKIERESYA